MNVLSGLDMLVIPILLILLDWRFLLSESFIESWSLLLCWFFMFINRDKTRLRTCFFLKDSFVVLFGSSSIGKRVTKRDVSFLYFLEFRAFCFGSVEGDRGCLIIVLS